LAQSKIFISYSHKDAKALEQLQRFIQPLERDGLLEYWADTDLEPGDAWQSDIETALASATVAVLLISQDFLTSKFIYHDELPRILTREAAGELTVIPVWLSPATVDILEFPFTDAQGEERKTKLTRFQGIGTPDKSLSTWSRRERAYKKLAERLQTLAGTPATLAMTQQGSVAPAASIPNLGPQVLPDTEAYVYELTVHLERQGNNLNVHYYLPNGAAVGSLTHAWDTVRKTLEPIHALLDGTDRAALQHLIEQAPTQCGAAFFELLFGPETAWELILRTLFGQPPPAPRRA
jgi:hypothetical protein